MQLSIAAIQIRFRLQNSNETGTAHLAYI